jgi:hypothetical protein
VPLARRRSEGCADEEMEIEGYLALLSTKMVNNDIVSDPTEVGSIGAHPVETTARLRFEGPGEDLLNQVE